MRLHRFLTPSGMHKPPVILLVILPFKREIPTLLRIRIVETFGMSFQGLLFRDICLSFQTKLGRGTRESEIKLCLQIGN